MKKSIIIILAVSFLFSCKKEITLNFTEKNIEFTESAIIDINIPKAEGVHSVSNAINASIENLIVNNISFSEDTIIDITLEEAIKKFDATYNDFKDDFEETALIWEALIDGEVTYQSPEITTIAINSYLNTGGAHGNMTISFLNFNSQTGELLQNDAIITNNTEFIKLAEKHFYLELKESLDKNPLEEDYFEEGFQLPENIGFSDDGIILLYNVYEIAPYSVGITEFTIPFEEANPYLKFN